jgi:group I intron endonuclease
MATIYGINLIGTDKWYIGSTIDFNKRKSQHLIRLKKNRHHSRKMQRAYNKYQVNMFKFVILADKINIKNLYDIENQFIQQYNSYHNGFNGRPTAYPPCIGEKNGMYGKSSSAKGQPNKNRKSLIRYDIRTGEIKTYEFVEKVIDDGFSVGGVIDSAKNHVIRCKEYFFFYLSDFNLIRLRDKFLKYNTATRCHIDRPIKKYIKKHGYRLSKEHKLKIKSKMKSGKENHKSRKIIRSDGKIYETITEAAKEINRLSSNIVSHLTNNKPKSVAGYTYQYLN